MNEIAAELNNSASDLSSTVSLTNDQVVNVAAGTEEASVNTQTVSSAAEELSVTIGEINQQIANSAQKAANAYREAESTNSLFKELSVASDEIGKVVCLINDVAEQTNLLALNATIEAARAGELAKGLQ